MNAREALPFLDLDKWRWRWMVIRGSRWDHLHRVAEVVHDLNPVHVGVYGRTVCGLWATLLMPGFGSRMGCPRCAHCCDRLGLARGDGVPYNEGVDA